MKTGILLGVMLLVAGVGLCRAGWLDSTLEGMGKRLGNRAVNEAGQGAAASIGNITPREAVKTPEGKRRLIDLLKDFENQNERALRKGIKSADAVFFPVEKVRKELGL